METLIIKVQNEVGLHARPAAAFVQEAAKFDSRIKVRNVTSSGEWANAKSILSVLTLGVEKNNQIELIAEGEDEDEAIRSLKALIDSDFLLRKESHIK